MFKNWAQKGVTHVIDIIKLHRLLDTISFKQKEEIQAIVGVDPRFVMQHHSLKKAIPMKIIGTLITHFKVEDYDQAVVIKQNGERQKQKIEQVLKMTSKELRKIVGLKDNIQISSENFWKRKLNFYIRDHYNLAHQVTTESRLRVLHFKLLHNIYPTNILLHKMGVKDSDSCDSCNEKDYIEHMFFYCSAINRFWELVSRSVLGYTGVRIDFKIQDILFGIVQPLPKTTRSIMNKINYIILVAKMCISKTRYGKIKDLKLVFELEMNLRGKYLDK